MTAPLSKHTVHVPPRQTVHVAADLREEAASVVLTQVAYVGTWLASDVPHPTERPSPRESLFLGIARSDAHVLAPGATSFEVPSHKKLDVAVGNWSDCPLEVSFEIWGKP